MEKRENKLVIYFWVALAFLPMLSVLLIIQFVLEIISALCLDHTEYNVEFHSVTLVGNHATPPWHALTDRILRRKIQLD
jgi:hypothetical protein